MSKILALAKEYAKLKLPKDANARREALRLHLVQEATKGTVK